MPEIGSLYVTIGADASKFSRALSSAKKDMREFAKGAEQLTREGADFRRLGGGIDDYIGRLRAATPENAKLAAEAGKVVQAFEGGEMSAADAAKALERLQVSAQGLSGDLQYLGGGFQNAVIVIGAVTAALYGMKQAWDAAMDFGKAGAELDYTEGKFDRLARKVGTTADVMLTDLRAATRGLVSDSELMASAGDFMALGLAKTSDEVVRLSRVAGGLNMDMNQLVLTLTNQTTMRFDQLGVSVDGFDEKVENLKKTGMSASDAFKEAFLQQAEEQLKTVGERADSAASAFDRYDRAVKNAADNTKREWMPVLAKLADFAADVISSTMDVNTAVAEQSRELATTAGSWEEYVQQLAEATSGTGAHVKVSDGQVRVLLRINGAMQDVTEETGALNREQWENARSAQEAAKSDEHLKKILGQMKKPAEDAAEGVDELNRAYSDLKEIISGGFGAENEDFLQSQDDIQQKIKDTQAELAKLGVPEFMTPENAAQVDELTNKLKNVNGQMYALAEGEGIDWKTLANTKDLADLEMPDDIRQKIKDLRNDSYNTAQKIRELGGLPYATPQQLEDIDNLRGKLGEYQGDLDELAAKHEETMRRMAFDAIAKRAEQTGGELTETELANLTELGKAWGIYDETTAAVLSHINQNISVLDTSSPEAFFESLEKIWALPEQKNFEVTVTTQTETPTGTVAGAEAGGEPLSPEDMMRGYQSGAIESVTAIETIGTAATETMGIVQEETGKAQDKISDTKPVETLTGAIDQIDQHLSPFENLGAAAVGAQSGIIGLIGIFDTFIARLQAADGMSINIDITAGGGGGGGGTGLGGPDGIPGVDPEDIPGGATGLSMIVPAGYPNDTYPIRASSGEHVKITPLGQTEPGEAPVKIVMYNNIENKIDVEQLAYRMAAEVKRWR